MLVISGSEDTVWVPFFVPNWNFSAKSSKMELACSRQSKQAGGDKYAEESTGTLATG